VEHGADSDDVATHSATLALITEEGQIVGTIAYVSPEQPAGGSTPARASSRSARYCSSSIVPCCALSGRARSGVARAFNLFRKARELRVVLV
jgi:hypothetical protein